MKRVDIQLGGLLPSNDLFQHIQDGTKESLQALVEAFGIGATESFKLWGVEVTISGTGGVNAAWTAGAIVLNGEICMVDAGSTSRTLSQTFRFAYADSWATEEYEGGSALNTRLTRRATIVAGTAVFPVVTMAYDAPYLFEKIAGAVVNTGSTGGAFDTEPGETWTVAPADVVINYSKAINGLVTLNFYVATSAVSGSVSWLVWNLPTAIRPVLYEAHGACLINGVLGRFELKAGSNNLKIWKADGSAISGTVLVRGTVQYYV